MIGEVTSIKSGVKTVQAGYGMSSYDAINLVSELSKLDQRALINAVGNLGVDLSENLISEAKKRVKGVKFFVMDMLSLEFKPESFDGVWCMASLVHNQKKDIPYILNRINKVLKEEGTLFVSVKEGQGEELVKSASVNNLPRFYSYFTQIEIELLLKDAGFDILYSTVVQGNPNYITVFCRKVS